MINPNLSAHLDKLRRDGCSQAALDKAAMLHGAYTLRKTQRLEREARRIRRARVVLWGGVILAAVTVAAMVLAA